MATEIERKFLVVGDAYRREATKREMIMQAYLSSADWIFAIRDGDLHISNMDQHWTFPIVEKDDWDTLVSIASPSGQIYTEGRTIVRARSYAVFADISRPSVATRIGGLITIKSPTAMARDDGTPIVLEVNIETGSEYVAEALIERSVGGKMRKTRWHVPVQDHSLEVDAFHDLNQGLVVAELEYHNEEDTGPTELPSWVGKEVTGVSRYYNSELAARPFTMWDKHEQLGKSSSCGNCDTCPCRVQEGT